MNNALSMKKIKSMPGIKILVVDDEPDLSSVISSRFELEGCDVMLASNGSIAIDVMRTQKFDAVISDIRMPGADGIELLDVINKTEHHPVVVLISGFSDVDPKDAIARGANALLVKPFDLDDMITAVYDALKTRSQ